MATERPGVFGLVAPPQERTTTPVLPRPEVKPAPVSPEPGKPLKTKKQRHTVRNIALGVTAVGALGAGAYETIPAVHRLVDSAFLDHLRGKSSEASVPEVFDTKATEGIIGDNNILRGVSKEAIQQMPQFDEKGEPLLLIVTPKEGQVSKFNRKLAEGGILPDILADAKTKNSKNKMEVDNIAKDTDIPLPIDGYVFLMIVERPGQSIFVGVKVEFMTPNNTLDYVNIGTTDNRRQAIVDAPRLSPENHNGRDYTKGLFLKRGTPIMRSLIDGNTVDYFRESGENGTLATNRRIPGDIIPLTIQDPATGGNKLPAQ